MKRQSILFVIVFVVLASLSGAGSNARANIDATEAVPAVVSYQGQIVLSGQPYNGSGYFKFAIIDKAATKTFWSNDGTSTVANMPVTALTLTVSAGQFNVYFGDTGQSPLSAAVFNGADRYLRVWFGTNTSTFTQLSPDQRIASTPFALQAQEAANASTLNGQAAGFYQNANNLNAGTLNPNLYSAYGDLGAEGYLDNNAAGDLLTRAQADGRYVKTGQTNSITATMIGSGTLTLDNLGQNGCAVGQLLKWNGSSWACANDHGVVNRNLGRVWTIYFANGLNEGQSSSITLGMDGFGLISYYDATNGALIVKHCGSLMCTGGHQTTVDTGGVGVDTSITLNKSGYGLVSYRDNTNQHLKVMRCGNEACNAGNYIVTVDTGTDVGYASSITTGKDGFGLISYYDNGNGDLKVAHCEEDYCSIHTVTAVDTTGDVGGFTSIAIGTDGLGLISYYDGTNADLKVMHCGNIQCNAGNSTSTVDSSGAVGGFNAITIGADGLGLISYYDQSNADLKVLHCGNLQCDSGNTVTTVDSTGIVGRSSAITIGGDGLGLISYYDSTNQSLKVLHCGNQLCNLENTIIVADTSGSKIGWGTSIVMGVDGKAMISYYDETNQYLKLAKLIGPGRR